MARLLIAAVFGVIAACRTGGAPAPHVAASEPSATRWWKGNTHTHTLWSDGDDFPEMVADWYRRAGYHFVAITDHNTLGLEEKWVSIPESGPTADAYRKYRERFGGDWLIERSEGRARAVRLRQPAEYRGRVEEPGRFLLVQGEEITQYIGEKAAHLNALNMAETVGPQPGGTLVKILRKDLDVLREQERRTGREIISVLNHPNFVWSLTAEDLLELPELRFFELYNAHPLVNTQGDGLHASTERIWDIVLSARLASGGGMLYGVAADDAHDYHRFAPEQRNPGRGWVMVRAPALESGALMAAMNRGEFYASTGVELSELRREGNRVSVAVDAERGVTYLIQFVGTRFGYDARSEPVLDGDGTPLTRRYGREVGIVLAEVRGPSGEYAMRGDELYVRARVISSKAKANPSFPGEVEMAWTQPTTAGPVSGSGRSLIEK